MQSLTQNVYHKLDFTVNAAKTSVRVSNSTDSEHTQPIVLPNNAVESTRDRSFKPYEQPIKIDEDFDEDWYGDMPNNYTG
jgi:hypothetical protein